MTLDRLVSCSLLVNHQLVQAPSFELNLHAAMVVVVSFLIVPFLLCLRACFLKLCCASDAGAVPASQCRDIGSHGPVLLPNNRCASDVFPF